jgi:hypothetical protein
MKIRTLRLAGLAAAAVAAVVAVVALSGGGAPSAHPTGRTPLPARAQARPATAPAARPAYAVLPSRPQASAAAPDGTESPSVLRARDLARRIQQAAASAYDLPEDLRKDLLAFLAGGEENRTALFSVAWEPGTPRTVVGHLRLFLMGLKDASLRDSLVASLDSFDPSAALRAEMAGKSRDTPSLVSELQAMPSGKARTDRIFGITKETAAEPAVAAMLLQTARDDADVETRAAAYNRLALAGVTEALPLLVAVAGDEGHTARDRAMAAYALSIHPAQPAAEDLLRLYERGDDAARFYLMSKVAAMPADRRVDDLLLEVLSAEGTADNMRKSASNALAIRIFRLPAEEARDLGSRVADAVRSLTAERAALALTFLGNVVVRNQPLREAVVDLHRSAPPGGAVQLAIAASPALRMVAGL